MLHMVLPKGCKTYDLPVAFICANALHMGYAYVCIPNGKYLFNNLHWAVTE